MAPLFACLAKRIKIFLTKCKEKSSIFEAVVFFLLNYANMTMLNAFIKYNRTFCTRVSDDGKIALGDNLNATCKVYIFISSLLLFRHFKVVF